MAQNRGLFGLFGKDIIDYMVASGQLDLRDIARLRQASRGMNGFLMPQFRDVAMRHHVMNADWDVVKKIVAVNPVLMFKRTSCVSPGGQLEFLSPLEHAFRVCDSNMWRMLLGEMQEDSPCASLFLEQATGMASRVSLVEPFFVSCQDFMTEAYRYLNHEIEINELNPCWLNLVARQRELPVHMLKELCRNGDSFDWDLAADFDVTDEGKRPLSCRLLSIKEGLFPKTGPLPVVLSAGCGVSLAPDCLLVRGRGDVCVVRLQNTSRPLLATLMQRLEVDVSALFRLQEVRELEFAAQVALLQDAQSAKLSKEECHSSRPFKRSE